MLRCFHSAKARELPAKEMNEFDRQAKSIALFSHNMSAEWLQFYKSLSLGSHPTKVANRCASFTKKWPERITLFLYFQEDEEDDDYEAGRVLLTFEF